jgi:hypothetical protein
MNEALSRALFDKDAGSLSERLLTSRNWNLYNREFPVLDVGLRSAARQEFRVRLVARNWNEEPPSAELLNQSGEFLLQVPQRPGGIFNNSAHPATGRPFVCMAGVREYHIHPSHVNDNWENYKNKSGYNLGGILTQLWNAWLKCNT